MRIPEVFRFTRMERRGVVALLLLCGGYLIAKPFLFEELDSWPKAGLTVVENKESKTERQSKVTDSPPLYDREEKRDFRFSSIGRSFNPDTLDQSDWMSMGLSEKQASALMKYGHKIGGFSDEESFRSSFVVSDEFYAAIADDVEFDERLDVRSPSTETKKEITKTFDLNFASAEELTDVKGIGLKLSERIVKFRDVLGGFYSMDQLREVYGLKEQVIESIKSRCELTVDLRKLNINTTTEEQLYRHPYFRNGLSRAIVDEREKHGEYKSVKDVRRVYLVDEDLYNKILPYISTTDG